MTTVNLTNSSLFAIIDEGDEELIMKHKWRAIKGRNTFYAFCLKDGIPTLMHRLILMVKERSIHVDHKNGNGLDNRRCNIRKCSPAQNNCNRRGHKNNKTGFKGVSVSQPGVAWVARIRHNGCIRCLGSFRAPEDAARAYDRVAIELHGEFANVNFKQ